MKMETKRETPTPILLDKRNHPPSCGSAVSLSLSLSSLLHYASISGWEGTIDLLLDHGADPRQTCMTGETALHFAVSLRHGAAAETLLKRSQDLVNEADKVMSALPNNSINAFAKWPFGWWNLPSTKGRQFPFW